MAKANLPVNFKDDILKENMNGKRRFNMIQNSDGTVSFEDVTDYTQVGSTFGAAQINATNEAVNNAADASKIIDSLETIKANTQSGYIAGALAVKALNSNLGEIRTGTFTARGAWGDATKIVFDTPMKNTPNHIALFPLSVSSGSPYALINKQGIENITSNGFDCKFCNGGLNHTNNATQFPQDVTYEYIAVYSK